MTAPSPSRDTAAAALGARLLLTAMLLTGIQLWLAQQPAITAPALQLYGVFLALVGLAAFLWRLTGSLEASALGLAAYLGVVVWTGSPLMLVLAVAAGAWALFQSGGELLRQCLRPSAWFGAIAAALVILAVTHYADFLVLEKLRRGAVSQDTLMHASVASMVKTYGIVSTGINGVVALNYHTMSHRMFAALSVLSGVHQLEVYAIAQASLLCPVLIAAVAWAARRCSEATDPPRVAVVWMVTCLCLALVRVVPLDTWAVWDSYFTSESYTLALSLFAAGLPAVMRTNATRTDLAIGALLFVLAGTAKSSVGVLGVGLLGIRVILSGGQDRRFRLAISAGAAVLFTWLLFGLMSTVAAQPSTLVPFKPFAYAQAHSLFRLELRGAIAAILGGSLPALGILAKAVVAVVLYLLFNFLFSWAVLGRRIAVSGWRGMKQPDAVLSLAAVALAVAALQFDIIGVWYFINPAMFVALPVVVLALSQRLVSGSERLVHVGLAVLTMAGAAFTLHRGWEQQTGVFLKTLPSARLNLAVSPHVDALLAMRDQQREHPVVFAPDDSFPSSPRGYWDCAALPFVYPAVTERAWTGILNPAGPCEFKHYGYAQYLHGQPRELYPAAIPPGVPIVRVGGSPSGR